MRGNRQPVLRFLLAGLAAALAIVLLASTTVSDRVDSTILILLGAAAAILLIPWDKLASLKAVGVEITLNLPHVREAVDSLDRISRASGGDPVDNAQVRRALERLDGELEFVAGSRVLWIDDNPLQIVGVRRLLRALGADIVLATSTRRVVELFDEDNDFDLVISDLMRNDPRECVTFEWMCREIGADRVSAGEQIVRDDGMQVAFAVRETSDGLAVYQRREGVNFVVQLRNERSDPVTRQIPVLFYASFPPLDAQRYARPAMLPGFEADVTNSAETLIPAAVRMIAASRSSPILVGGEKVLVQGGTGPVAAADVRTSEQGRVELARRAPN